LGLRQHSCKEKPKKEGGGLSKGERKRGGIFPSWDYLAQLLLDYTLERFKQTGFLFGQQRKIKGQLFFKKEEIREIVRNQVRFTNSQMNLPG
jgi:hypothetical protein